MKTKEPGRFWLGVGLLGLLANVCVSLTLAPGVSTKVCAPCSWCLGGRFGRSRNITFTVTREKEGGRTGIARETVSLCKIEIQGGRR